MLVSLLHVWLAGAWPGMYEATFRTQLLALSCKRMRLLHSLLSLTGAGISNWALVATAADAACCPPAPADAVTVYSRTLLQTPDWFLQFCEATGPQLAQSGTGLTSTTGEQLLLGFLDRWLDKFDAIGTPAARKLSALALCNVITLPVSSVLQRLDPIAAHLTAVWFEVHPHISSLALAVPAATSPCTVSLCTRS